MKLNDVKTSKVDEMAKPADICVNCGQPKAKGHYLYKGQWKCRGKGTPFQSSAGGAAPQAAAASAPSTQVDDEPSVSNVQAPPAAEKPAAAKAAAPSSDKEVETQIATWLQQHNITGYHYENGVINVDGEAAFRNLNRKELPPKVQFGEIGEDFVISSCNLSTLRGCPSKVGTSEYGGNFLCNHNNLTNLEGGPEEVNGFYSCSGNDPLTSLKGVARVIKGSFLAQQLPNLKSLEGIQDMIDLLEGDFDATGTKLESHVVGLMLIEGLQSVKLSNDQVAKIINKHLKEGRNPYDCQEELIDAGFDAFAQL